MFSVPKLQFAPDQEAAYRISVLQRIVMVSRFGLAVGAFAIPAFVVNDLLFDPDALSKTLPFRVFLGVLNALAFAAMFVPRIQTSPTAIRLIFGSLFPLYSLFLVLIQASHTNGFLITVPGYIQVMVFIPIICFSFLQAVGVMSAIVAVAVVGSLVTGASDVELANLANWLLGSGAFALGAAFVVDTVSRRSFKLEQELAREKARSDELLVNILPVKIAERLKNKENRIADHHPCATVLFADISGFTALSRSMEPGDLVDFLNDLFSRFDQLAERHGVEKIKTIGDGYMAVAGLEQAPALAAVAATNLAVDMQSAFAAFCGERDVDLGLRIGIHSGPVVAGVIGSKKFAFDLWGDAVNVASRVESSCPANQVQITREVLDLIGSAYCVQSRGQIDIRGHQTREVFVLDDTKVPQRSD